MPRSVKLLKSEIRMKADNLFKKQYSKGSLAEIAPSNDRRFPQHKTKQKSHLFLVISSLRADDREHKMAWNR